jgi:phytoene dehydrogenase-like protein
VLVIESRARVGGACTIEEPFPGVRMSPCAYLAGLLHPLVVRRTGTAARGYVWTPAVNGLFVPFLDGSSIQLWDDDDRCEEEVRALAPGDVEGWRAMGDVIRRLRDALRPAPGASAICGLAMRPRASRSKTGSATTKKRVRLSSTGRWRSLWSATLKDERLQLPIWVRA